MRYAGGMDNSLKNGDGMSLRLLIIDDHPLFLEGISAILRQLEPDIHIITAADAERGLAAVGRETPDLVLLDLSLPDIDGFTAIGEFHRRFPSLPVVVLSARERETDMRRAVAAGALGYIPKSSSPRVLLEALRLVQQGVVYLPVPMSFSICYIGTERRPMSPVVSGGADLSLRQLEVLAQICLGHSNKQIALDLGLSEKTIKSHVTSIFRTLRVVSRTQAVLVAKNLGMITR